MKVEGSGDPRTLTVRLQPCEFNAWRDELCSRLLVAAKNRDCARGPAAGREGNIDDGAVVALSTLLEQAQKPVAAGQPRVLVGPTRVLADVIRSVATDAMERYVDLGRAFCEGRMTATVIELRAALDTATACTATAIGLARAETDAHA